MKKGIDYIGVGVGAVIMDSDGRVFLAKRGREARNEKGKWEFPGGAVEFGETLEHAIVREVREEYGFDIAVGELLDVVDHIIPEENQHWVSPTFLCTMTGGLPSIREPHKCDAINWFSPDRIPEDLLTIASSKSLASLRKKQESVRSTCEADVPSTGNVPFPVDAILLLGPTGVGKSPLGEAVAENGLFGRRCHHLDFGDELRAALGVPERSARYTDGELDFIRGVLERGLLLENEHFPLAKKIISLFLGRSRFARHDLLLLNGIPRHAGQAQDMASVADIRALIVLECSGEDVFRRIRDNTGGDRTERTDDNRELIEKKLSIFQERTAPLIDHYRSKGSTVYRLSIAATTTPSDAYRLLSALAAAHPPIAFVAEPPQ